MALLGQKGIEIEDIKVHFHLSVYSFTHTVVCMYVCHVFGPVGKATHNVQT